MRLRRRRFLGLTAGTCLSGGCAATTTAPSTPPTATSDRWAEIRAQFDQDPAYLNFAGFLLAPHPRPVREALANYREQLDRNPAVVLERELTRKLAGQPNVYARARDAAAGFLDVPSEQIALTDSTTMGLGLVYGGIRVAQGKELLIGSHGHYSTHEAVRLRTLRGEKLSTRTLDLYADPAQVTVDEITTNLRRELRPTTRVVGVTWVHSSTGVKLPIRAIADVLAEHNRGLAPEDRALLVVDGVHGFGIDDVTMADLGCDVFIAGCHKWIFGPRGTGLVWATPEAWSEIVPTIPAFEMAPFMAWLQGRDPGPADGPMHSPGGFHSFENRWALAEAFEFHTSIGRAEIEARIHELNTRLKQGLAAIPKVRLFTPLSPEFSAGINAFEVDGVANEAVVERLMERKIIASVSPYRVPHARLASGLLNYPAQVDQALEAVSEIAG